MEGLEYLLLCLQYRMEYRVPKMQTPETNQKVFADWMRDDGKLNKNVGRGQEESKCTFQIDRIC